VTIAEYARILREELSLSQQDAAEFLERSQAYVSLLESGKRPDQEALEYVRWLEGLKKGRDTNVGLPNLIAGLAQLDHRGPSLVEEPLLRSVVPDGWELLDYVRASDRSTMLLLHRVEPVALGLAQVSAEIGVYRCSDVVELDPLYARWIVPALLAFISGALGTTGPRSSVPPRKRVYTLDSWAGRLLRGLQQQFGTRRPFLLAEVYDRLEETMAAAFPNHHDPRAGIRATLQRLRDDGRIEFLGGGRYRLLD
jgi:transcriptional regulator with XRE-family HTH domain